MYPQNLTEHIAIDELTLSRGELYTYLTSKDRKSRKGVLIGSVQGTKAQNIITAISQIPLAEREKVKEVSLDMAANMHLAASTLFPKARLVTDRFHVVKLVLEALQKIRIDYRWEAIALENKQIKHCRRRKIPYQLEKMGNGETRKEILARSRFLLFKKQIDWTDDQKSRAKALFRNYPKLREAYRMTLRFRAIYEQTDKEMAARKFRLWIKQIKTHKMEAFNSAANSLQYHMPTILNFFHRRSTNAHAESFNARIKGFRANLRGVSNPLFFLFRLEKLFA